MIKDDASGETWTIYDRAVYDAWDVLEWHAQLVECEFYEGKNLDRKTFLAMMNLVRQAQEYVSRLSESVYRETHTDNSDGDGE